jgi:phthiocerol/phenolphthiocerol synthesis type-I polyketide synthase E
MSKEQVNLGQSIALVGRAGRFFGMYALEEFWRTVADGESYQQSLPATPEQDAEVSPFDAAFFGVSPDDSAQLGPGQRNWITRAWEALEAAGYAHERHTQVIGVFTAGTPRAYLDKNPSPGALIALLIQSAKQLHLEGTAVGTSTSREAVCEAMQSLASGTVDVALAGGDGDRIVVLKRLADALRDRDPVLAVIRGTAADHVTLEGATPIAAPPVPLDARQPTTLLISAKTPTALEQATQNLALWATDACKPGIAAWPLPEIAATLRDRRQALNHRRAVRVESWRDAVPALGDKSRFATGATLEGNPKLFVSLPGQGTVRPGALARLLAQGPEWACHLDHFAQIAKAVSGFDCRAWLSDPHADPDVVLKDNARTQLTVFCVGTALARWLMDMGVRPDGYVGHSLGEWMAAVLAGVLSDEDAMRAVYHRGRLMQSTGPGAALIVKQSAETLAARLPPGVTLACVNAPDLCLVSGRPEAITSFAARLAAESVFCRVAPIYVAVHSPAMDAVVEPFLHELEAITFHAPRTPVLSTVTGQWMTAAQACDRKYWAGQLRSTVQFAAAVATLLAEPCAVILEVGMGSALTSLVATRIKDRAHHRALALLGREEPPAEGYSMNRLYQSMGEIWASGVPVDLVGAVESTRAAPILPTYPFQRPAAGG